MKFYDYRQERRRLYLHELTFTQWLRVPLLAANYHYRTWRALRFARQVIIFQKEKEKS